MEKKYFHLGRVALFFLLIISANSCASPENQPEAQLAVVEEKADEVVPTLPPTDDSYVNGVTDKNRGDKKGKMSLKGSFSTHCPHKFIYLYETEGRFYYKIDSTEIKDQAFDFGTREYRRGFYKLMVGDENNMVSFIMNPDETEVELLFGTARLEHSFASVKSNENMGWAKYQRMELANYNKVRGLKNQRAKADDKAQYDRLIKQEDESILKAKHDAINAYPDTYLAKYLTYRQMPYHDDLGNFWSDLDFNDESIIRSTVITLRMNEFMRTHSGGTDAGFIKCIDLTKAHAEVNAVVLEFTLFTMLDGFHQSNKETICQYILDNYIFDEDCGAELTDVIRERAKGIINLQIGNVPPDFTIEKHNGGMLNKAAVVADHSYTLIMFWSSWCHKCEQEMPVLKGVYSEYNPKGFEIIGISVDTDRGQWLAAIDKKSGPWPNVSQLNAWKSPVAQDYRVTATPTLFLVDQTGTIVLKPKRIYEVLNFLKANLK
jgi:thiol-disulfide isomerase/thioredoxin